MSEWDEERMANILGRVGKSVDVFNYVPSGNRALDDFVFVLQAANAERKTADDLRALLAQRDGELEALRGLLQDAIEALEAEGLDTEYFERRWLFLYPESPALTDKEEGE